MTILRLLLWPFSLLYGGIMKLRNFLYDRGLLKSRRFAIPVVAVGNLTVGGTGKTPHVEYLLRLLHGHRLAVLSRGYKRQSKGFVLADEKVTAATLGDEPYQYHRDFPDVTVAVCESRVEGISKLQSIYPELELVVLDDAMQHRAVQPSFNILLTDFHRLFYKDQVLPAGLLREPRKGAMRADAVVVSKCPADLSIETRSEIEQRIRPYCRPDTPVYFSYFRYGRPVPLGNAAEVPANIILLTGIANAQPMVQYLRQNFTVVQHLAYADHYQYAAEDLLALQRLVKNNNTMDLGILTTRKDAVKLTDPVLRDRTRQLPIFYLPIEVAFIQGGHEFDAQLLQHIASFTE